MFNNFIKAERVKYLNASWALCDVQVYTEVRNITKADESAQNTIKSAHRYVCLADVWAGKCFSIMHNCYLLVHTGVFLLSNRTGTQNVYWSSFSSTRLVLRIYLHNYYCIIIIIIRTPSVVVQNHCTPRDRELPTCYCAWPQKILFLQRKRSGKGNMIIVSVFTHRSRIPCTSYTT